MRKVTPSRASKPSRIVSKKYAKKYSIKAQAPMKTVTTFIPTKVATAKLDYDIAVEEQIQSSISRDIASIEQQLVNERNRYQITTKKFVKGESQLNNDSQNYSMLKRQQEQLQRQQESSADRLFNLKTQKTVSVDPVTTATKSLRGISRKNPMKSKKNYVPTIPSKAVASPGPLGNLDDTFQKVLGSAQNLIPSLPSASALPSSPVRESIEAAAKGITSTSKAFSGFKTKGESKMMKKIVNKERLAAMSNATPEQVKSVITQMVAMNPEKYKGMKPIELEKAARVIIGNDVAKQTKSLLGEKSNVAFVTPTEEKIGSPTGPMSAAEAASYEQRFTQDYAVLTNQKIYPGKKGSGRFYSENLTKKMIAAGTVFGSGTAPLGVAYGENPTQQLAKNDMASFFKGASDYFSLSKKTKPKQKRRKKKGKR